MRLIEQPADGPEHSTELEGEIEEVLQAMGAEQSQAALQRCLRLLKSAPRDGRLHLLVGILLRQAGQHAQAIDWLRRAVELKPQSEEAWMLLAGEYEQTGNKAAAVICLTKCLQLKSGNPEVWLRLGNLCHQLGDNERAASLYEKASRLQPANQAIWANLGKALRDLGRLEQSVAAYDRALALDPDNPRTHCNRAIALLVGGRLQEGLREFEWRRRVLRLRQYPKTMWKGERIPGKTLLLTAEQGCGDMIQFIRFASQARQRAGRVILECHPSLKRLMEASDVADEVCEIGRPLPAFDYYSPLMSLPALFGISLETILAPNAYLAAPAPGPFKLESERRLKAGVVWAGNPEHGADAERSLRLETLRPLLSLEEVCFVNLQVPVPQRDLTTLQDCPSLTAPPQPLASFYDTAAVIGQLDLVISVDTAVAHLAGALGKPVWTLIPRFPDWRWLLERADTPWYPTMRLFRQAGTGQWEPVLEAVAAELRRLASENQHPTTTGKP